MIRSLALRASVWTTAIAVLAMSVLTALVLGTGVSAQTTGEFSLQVSPSPLVTTVKPGQTTELELKIRNAGASPEDLKIEPRSFTFDNTEGTVALDDTSPPDVAQWISFSNPTFTVLPGQWFTEKIRVSLPKDSGFSYSFALVISRQNTPQPTEGGRLIKGSVAVFTLINVDRPGATRSLDVAEFVASKRVYEYLPAELSVKLKNTGNTIVQPYGNIFIQRGSDDASPLATLPVNETRGYILPGKERSLEASWGDGFPVYTVSVDTAGVENRALTWKFGDIAQFRIGRYTAKLVAVYNDGQRDVPLQAEVTFWVIPWKIILGFIVVFILVGIGLWSFMRKITRLFTRKKSKKPITKKVASDSTEVKESKE